MSSEILAFETPLLRAVFSRFCNATLAALWRTSLVLDVFLFLCCEFAIVHNRRNDIGTRGGFTRQSAVVVVVEDSNVVRT